MTSVKLSMTCLAFLVLAAQINADEKPGNDLSLRGTDAIRKLTSGMDWSVISPLLNDPALASTLPPIPSTIEAQEIFGSQVLAELVPYTLTSFPDQAALCDSTAFAATRAGPIHSCTSDTCSGASGDQCRAVINGESILLRGKLGTWWARALGEPAWMQFTFPKVLDSSTKFEFKFTLDGRYRPEMYGGNACETPSDSSDCALCTVDASWDHNVPAGVHVLWSAAGRQDYIVTGPFELGSAWDNRDYTQTFESPDELALGPDEYPTVTLFMVSQYPQYGEVGNPNSCSVAHSNQSGYSYKDKSLMVKGASISYYKVAADPPTATDWSSVSLLLDDPAIWPMLPTIPTPEDVSNLYGPGFDLSNGAPFAIHKIENFEMEASLCGNFAAARAGPMEICTSDNCSGLTIGSEQCRATINNKAIQLRSRLGTHWARALGGPAWIQFSFPAVPQGSTEFSFSFTIDGRYRPELFGGNACDDSGTSGYFCQLCTTDGPWDHTVGAGVFVLWTAAGRNEFVVTGPYELGSAYDSGQFVRTLQAPAEMNYVPGDFPVVTFLTFSQYPTMGEVSNPSSCSISESDELGSTFRDKPLMIEQVSLMYRSNLTYTKEPAVARPRLYGTDAEWLFVHVDPFFNAPCDQDTASHVGWFETEGYISMKSHFDIAARGFYSCEGGVQSDDISSWNSLSDYFVDGKTPGQTGGYRAFHLLRRLWACANANNGNYSTCEYNHTETSRLAAAVATKEMGRFAGTSWSCGASCGGNGGAAFDLTTAEQVSYFVHFFDVISSQGSLLTSEDVQSLETTLQNQIELFINTFDTGKWQLWNGNNWTPHLCVAALEWAIVFWHEKNDMALEVLKIVNDIMHLHQEYYTEDGVYTEGVAMYGFMSLEGQMAMAALTRASFGFSPASTDVETLQKTALYFIASMATDGYLIDFGDSHRKRGWGSNPMSVVEAAISPASVNGETVNETSINSDQARAFASSLYGSGGFYVNPWRIRGDILQFDSLNLRSPPAFESQPLGGSAIDVFERGGYTRFLTPLLDTGTPGPVCFDTECIDPALPSLWDNIPYSSVSVQARPNTFAHSEVDFGTFTWSAWGSRLISDFGYGTIATSVNEWDMRRYLYLDNNPAGHNTVVIREAFQPGGDETVNFSQLNYVAGTLSPPQTFAEGSSCVLMDGSEPYGSSRPDGWLDIMKRYVCSVGGNGSGNTFIVDLIQTKANRAALDLYGSMYGGPDFTEPSPAAQRLTIDEYFYLDTEADIDFDSDGNPSETLPFNRDGKKWCNHIDAELLSQHNNASIALRPVCGIGGYRAGDGMGVISGISLGASGSQGGSFEYDGLVTSVNRWLQPHALKKRRFRFVTDQTVGTEGDARAFVLSPSLATNPLQPPPDVALEDCSTDVGCTGSSAIECSCVQLCVDTTLKRATILNGELSTLEDVGSC